MEVLSIPSLNKTLEQLNSTFQTETYQLISKISQHQAKFTSRDCDQFKALIEEIKIEAMSRINIFFKVKIQSKTQIYENHINKYQSAAQNIESQLIKFQSTLKQQTLLLKQEQNRKQALMEHFSKKYRHNFILKQAFGAFKKNYQAAIQQKKINQKMKSIYQKNLFKKVFFPWRSLTYKDGYQATVKEQVYNDVTSIHNQYQSIISILKAKITETDELIKLKKAAKGEFAYALNKNLLKTISNLSLEVMSLNQISLNDGEIDSRQNKSFMAEVDMIISQKMRQVEKYRKHLIPNESKEKGQEKRTKKIKFVQNQN